MSRVNDLVLSYRRYVRLPWQRNLAPAQRVWMVVYAPEDERRLRLHVREFENESRSAGYEWELVDLTTEFEQWMAMHDYREEYFASPQLMDPELVSFFDHLVERVRDLVAVRTSDQTIVGVLGAGSLVGLGDSVKVSALVERVEDLVRGRLLVFFPGEVEGNNYRLLGVRDGWNYHAVRITAERGGIL